MFEGFETKRVEGEGTEIHLRIGGSGPPLLLLHGHPQTHAMWHLVAPALAERFTVVSADLRGYGDSGKPASDPDHLVYSKRSTAADMVAVMRRLGFARFMLAGHDRGGRVAHRLALDHPEALLKLCVLDIVPTRTLFLATDKAIATGYWHWFFLIQPYDLPERLIGADPVYYLHKKLASSYSGGIVFAPEALAEYERCIRDPAMVHAACEDYRAAASIDLEHDEADLESRRIDCPVLALWGARGLMDRHFDVVQTWRERASGPVEGFAVDCGHFIPEEAPDATIRALSDFFDG